MDKHTPGPWTEYAQSIYSRESRLLAKIQYPENGTDGEVKANAALIAAAPELLEALKGWVRITNGKTGGAVGTLRMEALDIIAKAEGR